MFSLLFYGDISWDNAKTIIIYIFETRRVRKSAQFTWIIYLWRFGYSLINNDGKVKNSNRADIKKKKCLWIPLEHKMSMLIYTRTMNLNISFIV